MYNILRNTKKWKVQGVEPSTCESWIEQGAEMFDTNGLPFEPPRVRPLRRSGCRYYEMFDSLNMPPKTPVVVCAVIRVCPAHRTDISVPCRGKMLWQDGNWKLIRHYIKYQKDWFLHLNYLEWIERGATDDNGDLQPMPPQLLDHAQEPRTPGSVAPPPAAEIADLYRVYNWNREHNHRLSKAQQIIQTALGLPQDERPSGIWTFKGHGDDRILYLTEDEDGLTTPQKEFVKAAADIEFGPGKLVVA